MAVGAPFVAVAVAVAVTVPFIPSGAGVIGFALIVTILAVYLWRDANNLQGHVRPGAEVLIELLARQRANASEIHDVETVLPGLDWKPMTPLVLNQALFFQTRMIEGE